MGLLIDTSVLIAFERGRINLSSHLAGREDAELFLSVITASELLHGVHRAQSTEIRTRRSSLVESFLQRLPILPIDLGIARVHAQLWADFASGGNIIGPHDLWIAATAIARGHAVVTANLREFQRVPGLVVESWSN